MKLFFRIFALTAICATTLHQTFAQGTAKSSKDEALLVYGQGFSFSMKKPAGWDADTGAVAHQYSVNLVLLPQDKSSRRHDVTIRVRVTSKVDENTEEDLKADMAGYKSKFPGVRFEGIPVAHIEYRTFAKLFFVPGKFYEYVAYLNPGRGAPRVFSVALSKKSERANEDELAAFTKSVQSLAFLTQNVIEK
jgi:hypothetical protein